jgi:S-(hydroxymethyl)glutathione dehydrogenase / alcohol dehydrogenase
MALKMKAAVLYEYGQPLVIEEVTLDPPQPGEVMIRMAASGICHSDVNVINGAEKAPLPIILGHEAAGIVQEVGDGVTRLKPGDRVIAGLWRGCGHCYFCLSGYGNDCETPHILDSETRVRDLNGKPIRQGMRVASWAEYVVVDQSQVVPVPDDIPLTAAALIGCGVITGIGAVINTAQVEAGSSVVVIGLGGVGVNSVQGARLAGARHVIAVDLLDSKLETARTFGATHTINAAREDPVKTVRELTAGRGADYVFVTVGSAQAIAQSFDMIRKRGTAVMIGLVPDDVVVPLPVTQVALTEQRVIGSYLGSTRLSIAVPQFIELYRQGRLKLDELVTAIYPLDQINEAVAVVNQGEAVRNVIEFQAG